MNQNFHPKFSNIIVEEKFGLWAARFQGGDEGWGGDTPGTAVERLWEAHLNSQAARCRYFVGDQGRDQMIERSPR